MANSNSFNFGTVGSGFSKTFSLYIKNTSGSGTLTLSSVGIVGSNGFSVSSVTSGTSVNSNDSLLVTLTFASTSSSSVVDTLIINSDDPDENPYKIILKANDGGTISLPDIDLVVDGASLVNNTTYDFGVLKVDTALQKTFVVQNSGGDTLRLNFSGTGNVLTTSGSDLNQYNFDETGITGKIAPGSTTKFAITFTPTSTGVKSAAFSISSNSPITPTYNITLSGTGETVPIAPTVDNLQLSPVISGTVSASLTWQDTDDETGYNIERSTNDTANFQQIGSTGTGDTTYLDATIEIGNQYYYRLSNGQKITFRFRK